MRNLFGNKKSVLKVCIFLVLIACFSFCCHMNEKEELNGTKAERRKFEEYDESSIMYPYIILDNSDLQNQINRQISDAMDRHNVWCGDNDRNEHFGFYGIWHIDKVVLQSKMYTGSVTDGDFEENLYDPEDYIGMEVEYNSEYLRLDSERYNSPEYIFTNRTVKDINEGGRFYDPDIYEFILDEKIEVINADHYNSLTEVSLIQIEVRFSEEVSYGDYDFIPVGTQCIILNEDTILIGIWGKILLAHRIL